MSLLVKVKLLTTMYSIDKYAGGALTLFDATLNHRLGVFNGARVRLYGIFLSVPVSLCFAPLIPRIAFRCTTGLGCRSSTFFQTQTDKGK